jgi:hypothetical protein
MVTAVIMRRMDTSFLSAHGATLLRPAAQLEEWKKDGTLVRDPAPAFTFVG